MKKILIVDDSKMIRHVVSKSSKNLGYETIEASNGKEGLEQLSLNSDVSLILSDINMPIMNGLEMIEQIKQKDNFKFIPVVMLTTETRDDLKQKGRDLGVKAWMVKPFNEKTFAKAIIKLIG